MSVNALSRSIGVFLNVANGGVLLYLAYFIVGIASTYRKFGNESEIGQMYRLDSYMGFSAEVFVVASLGVCLVSLILTWRFKSRLIRTAILCICLPLWVAIVCNDFGQGIP